MVGAGLAPASSPLQGDAKLSQLPDLGRMKNEGRKDERVVEKLLPSLHPLSLRPSSLPLCAPRFFLRLFEEEVLAPFRARLGVVAEQHALKADAERPLRREQGHARLFGRAVALARV